MKICQLVPGSGGTFYCQNCLRDLTLVRALQREGHEVVMMPLYLPPFGEGADANHTAPVFFGGINVYLQQRFPLFRKTPRWLDRFFDTRLMLKLAAAQERSTNAAKLGPMTLSMLEGRHGNQEKEFARLLSWLTHHEKPEVIHISNALLLGLATEIKRALDVPIVCSLQDEEPWVEAMPAPWKERCWNAMIEAAAHVDGFIATSRWYAARMSERLGIPRDRIQVVYLGVEISEADAARLSFDPPTIGYLSRLDEAQGLGVLVDAFIQLKQEAHLRELRLHATGGFTAIDRPFIASVRAKLRAHGFEGAVDFREAFQGTKRAEFLRSVSVLSTPAPRGEAFGIQLLEAMAMGVPVVQPGVGAYPEIIEATGGGLLYDPQGRRHLADTLRAVLLDPERARALGQQGRHAVRERFSIERVARDMADVYRRVRE